MTTRISPDDASDLVYIPLLKEEDARCAANTGILSANFYAGDIKAAHNELKSRLREVLRLNPWIAGVVTPLSKAPKQNPAIKGKIGKSVLAFPKAIADEDIDREVDSILTIEDEIDPRLQRSSAYRQLAESYPSDSRVVPNRSGLHQDHARAHLERRILRGPGHVAPDCRRGQLLQDNDHVVHRENWKRRCFGGIA